MRRLTALLVAPWLALCGTAAFAQEEPPVELAGTLLQARTSGAVTIAYRESSIPFSYLSARGEPIGYSIDLCRRLVEAMSVAVSRELGIKWLAVTSESRIDAIASGKADLECGSTTNNLDRQKQVGFTNTYFVTANRYVAKKASNIKSLADLKGKTIVSTAGTTNIKQITEINAAQNLGMNIISANGHPEAFQMVETGRAVAFVMDDILLAGLAAQSRSPNDYEISADALSVEPYGIMVRKDDKAFKAVVDKAMSAVYTSGQINAIYSKWFENPVPPKNINLSLPMGAAFKKVVAKPTDSGDPKAYE